MPIPVRPKPFLLPGCPGGIYAGLALLSQGCTPDGGRLHTCYSPVRHSPAGGASSSPAAVRLACVKPAASVHPEPGSNSPLLVIYLSYISSSFVLRPSGPGISGKSVSVSLGRSSLVSIPVKHLHHGVSAACLVAISHCPLSFPQPSSRSGFHCCATAFPDCGCKITTFFRPTQVFSKNNYVLQHIFKLYTCFSIISINVNLYFVMLTQ